MNGNKQNLYENGCACVRLHPGKDGMISRYEVLFSEGGNLDKPRDEMMVVARYFTHYFERYPDEKAAAFRAARIFCDRWKSGPEKRRGRKEIVYENEHAYALLDGFDHECVVYVKGRKGKKYIEHDRFERELSYRDNIGEMAPWDDSISYAKEICDRYALRETKRHIDERDYPDYPHEYWVAGGALGVILFLLFWVGVAIKSNSIWGPDGLFVLDHIEIFASGKTKEVYALSQANPFSISGLHVLAQHWWQTLLLILLSVSLGMFFWWLSRIRKFSVVYRVFTHAFGKAQALATGALWGVFALYWAAIGLFRSVKYGWRFISPIPDALGYLHFIVATIYLAVIAWGIVDFMKHRKRFPDNFSTNNIGVTS